MAGRTSDGTTGNSEAIGGIADGTSNGVEINEFINLNIAQIAPDFSGFLQSIQGLGDEGEGISLDVESGLPSSYALSTTSPISISPESWSQNDAAAGAADSDDDNYEAESDSVETVQISEDERGGDTGALGLDAAARGTNSVSSATPVATSSGGSASSAAQSAASGAGAATAARPVQATRPGRSGNIDQQQSTKVFDQLTGEVVITSVAIVPAIVLPTLAAAETASTISLLDSDISRLDAGVRDAVETRSAAEAADNQAEAETDEAPVEDAAIEAEAEAPQDETPDEAAGEAAAVAAEGEGEGEDADVETVAETVETAVEEVVEIAEIIAAEAPITQAAPEPEDVIDAQPEPAPEPEPEPEPEPVNTAPAASAISQTKSEEDATFTVDLLSTASDADGDTLSLVATPTVTAQDQDGNSVAVPDGAVSFTGAVMSVDPDAFDALTTGQSLTFTASYDVSDGTASTANTASITINGYTDPFVNFAAPPSLSLTENTGGDVTPIALGQVSATGHTTVSYSFENGTQAQGDFRIDATSGAITYVGTGEDFEAGSTASNIAPSASLSTTVPDWFNDDEAASLAAMVDGNTSTSGADDYAVHPENADGETITFDFDTNYTDPTFVFHNRSFNNVANRIDGSTVEYKYQGQTVHTETLDSANEVNDVITLNSPDDFTFDQVVLTFDGNNQNFREVEILAKQAPNETLRVRGTSGTASEIIDVDVDINDVDEAPVVTPINDSGKSEDNAGYTLDLLAGQSDPEGATLSVINTSISAVDRNGGSVTLPSGTIAIAGAIVTIDPSQLNALADGESRIITLNYEVSDGTADTANTATITLTGANDAPAVTPINDSGKSEDSAGYTLDLLAGQSDADGDALSVVNVSISAVDGNGASVTLPAGTASVSGATLSIDPSQLNALGAGESRVITVSYDVSDGTADTANTATITLTGANDAPAVTPINDSGKSEDSAGYTLDLLAGQSDADGDALSVVNVSISAVDGNGASVTLPAGTASVSGATLSIDPSQLNALGAGESRVITVSYDVSDGTADTANTATITLTGANDAPAVTPINDSGKSEDSAGYTLDLLAGQSDADGDALSVVNVSISAVDGNGASVTLPAGTASVSGATLSIDPSQLNALGAGESRVITVSYDVSDGTADTANTATITLTGVNDAPVVSAITDTKSEEDAAFDVDLLAGATDADGDSLSVVSTPTVTAQDRDGNAVTPPPGGVTFNGNIMSIDPNTFDQLNTGENLTLIATYDVTDGTVSVQNTATITINGYTDPFVTISEPQAMSLDENLPGDENPVSIGRVNATGHTTVNYSFENGTLADGDFRIDASSGAITYVGTGEDFEAGNTASNIAPSASLSTTVPDWFNDDEAASLAAMVDGSTSSAGADDYAVHPQNADGETITFDFDSNFRDPTFVFYSRTGGAYNNRINGSTVEYKYQGQTVHTDTIDSSTHNNYVTTIDAPDNFNFDQVVLTFDGASQNFREVEIFAKQAPVETLRVRATSGTVSDIVDVDVTISDINEAPVYSGSTDTQYASKNDSWSFVPGTDEIEDPENETLSYSASLQDGSALPGFLSVNSATGEISTGNASASGMFDLRLVASDGTNNTNIDFTLVVSVNAIPQAKIETTISAWGKGDEASNLSAMIDGNTSTAGDLDQAVQPSGAGGKTISFDLNAVYRGGIFNFYNTTDPTDESNIDNSTVTFSRSGSVVHTATLLHSNAVNGRIVTTTDPTLEFDIVVLTFSGDTQGFREIEIFGAPIIEWTSPQSFDFDENQGSGASVGALTATASAAVSFSFTNGTQSDGDFTVNAGTGAITYTGSGHDYESSPRSNIAASATITTTVEQFFQSDVDTALAAMVDGNTSTAGTLAYAVHPQNADGDNITFAFDRVYMGPEFKFYNRPGSGDSWIDGSTVSFRRDGSEVTSVTLDHNTQENNIITASFGNNILFDEVVLTFSGASQNFREIEIFAQAPASQTLDVRATAGGYTSDNSVMVLIGDVNEAPIENGALQDQTVNKGDTAIYTLPDNLFIDPERMALSYSAEMVDGQPLPDWVSFDATDLEFTFEPTGGEDEKNDISVYASDGTHSVQADFTVEVYDL